MSMSKRQPDEIGLDTQVQVHSYPMSSENMAPTTTPEKQVYWRMETPSPPSKPGRGEDLSPRSLVRHFIFSRPTFAGLMLSSLMCGASIGYSVHDAYMKSNTGIGFDSLFLKNATMGAGDKSNAFHVSTVEQTHSVEQDGVLPKLVWLMTFPNSGTSYTCKLIRHATGLSTATTYGSEYVDETGNSVPIVANSTTGPYLVDTHKYDYPKESMYILTKTHCGFRTSGAPKDYIESPSSFLATCLAGSGLVRYQQGKSTLREGAYSIDLVKKIVHLLRNPFDNAVSRFHLAKKHNRSNTALLPLSKEGFREFCNMNGQRWKEAEIAAAAWDNGVLDIMKDIPCYSDFYRYANWHNLAFAVTKDLDLPEYVLHYEDFETRFEETKAELLDFLQLEVNGDAFPFIPGKEYSNYFTVKEQRTLKVAMKMLSFKTTWRNIEHYFDGM